MLLSPALLRYSWLLRRLPYSGVGASTWQLHCYGSRSSGGGHCLWLCSHILCIGLDEKHLVLTGTSCHWDLAAEGELAQMLTTGSLLSWEAMTSAKDTPTDIRELFQDPEKTMEIFPHTRICVKIWFFCLLERWLSNKRGGTSHQYAPELRCKQTIYWSL